VPGRLQALNHDGGVPPLVLPKAHQHATACVLVDDVAANLPPAADVDMATIHHTDSSATVKALEKVFGRSLR
jgi:putative hydrolase of the HAD superfamily